MYYLLIIWILLLSIPGYSQTDSAFIFDKSKLNISDEKGRMHGFWIQYLSEKLKPCKMKKAHFYGYELYDHGERVQKFYFQLFKRRCRLKSYANSTSGGRPILLDGTFEWYRKNGKLIAREIFKEGSKFHCQSFKFSRKHPDKLLFTEILYFDKLYSGKVGTFYYEQYSRGRIRFRGFFRKRDRGWRVYGNSRSDAKFRMSNL